MASGALIAWSRQYAVHLPARGRARDHGRADRGHAPDRHAARVHRGRHRHDRVVPGHPGRQRDPRRDAAGSRGRRVHLRGHARELPARASPPSAGAPSTTRCPASTCATSRGIRAPRRRVRPRAVQPDAGRDIEPALTDGPGRVRDGAGPVGVRAARDPLRAVVAGADRARGVRPPRADGRRGVRVGAMGRAGRPAAAASRPRSGWRRSRSSASRWTRSAYRSRGAVGPAIVVLLAAGSGTSCSSCRASPPRHRLHPSRSSQPSSAITTGVIT